MNKKMNKHKRPWCYSVADPEIWNKGAEE